MKIEKKFWIVIGLLLLIPLVVTIILSFMFFGDPLEIIKVVVQNRNKLTFSAEAYPTLSEAINYLITGYSIVITGTFSYVIWKTSVRSYEVAEAVKSLEEKRDLETVRQSALIVYYELLTAFSNLRDLYISVVIENKSPNPNKLFFSEDWIKNISLLRDILSPAEINEIHKIYSRFLTIKNLLEVEVVQSKLVEHIKETVNKSFASFLFENFIRYNFGDVTKYLKRDCYIILSKIRIASYTAEKIEKTQEGNTCLITVNNIRFYRGSIVDGLFEGNGTLYTEHGLVKYEGVFRKGRFITGNAKEYHDSGKVLFEIAYENDRKLHGNLTKEAASQMEPYYFNGEFLNNEIINGYVTQFDRDHKILYEGYLKDDKFSGKGTLYNNGNKRYEGLFEEGEFVYGKQFAEMLFEGEFRNQKPFTGKVKNYSNYIVREFNGRIVEGQPFEGHGLIFQKDYNGRSRDYREFLEESREFNEYEVDHDDEYGRRQQEWINNYTREEYSNWEDYIFADWINGDFKEREDKEENKRVFYIGNNK